MREAVTEAGRASSRMLGAGSCFWEPGAGSLRLLVRKWGDRGVGIKEEPCRVLPRRTGEKDGTEG